MVYAFSVSLKKHIKMKDLKYLQRLFLLLAVGFSLSFVCACGDDEEDEPFDDPNQGQIDNGGGSQNDGTASTDSIMPPAEEEPSLPNDSTSGGENVPMIPTDSILGIGGHEAVDLGLSVKWATCNVGASSPEDYGDYFAWGETTTKSSYDSDNSITDGLSYSELQSRGIIDADGNLTAAYDAATANWGGSWRMPTLDEIEELLNNCTWTWTTQNGVNGREVTGPNGNSIFFPASGGRYGTDLSYMGFESAYWSATPPFGYSNLAYCFYFYLIRYECNGEYRYYGHSVRPVSD